MRALLKNLLLAGLAGLVGLLIFGASPVGSVWQTVGMALLMPAAVSFLFSAGDLIYLALQRWASAPSKATVFTHLCAGLMLLLALATESDPRLQGSARYVLLAGLPLSVYVFRWLYRTILRSE
ncbi:hypothetical protein [Herbaspirillum sp. SJZ107]|uniref:hypothetical protein n=1 Tax=Herbaspirillum sp. SJZ107 TaxID=2572881 RepID=UPI001153EA92|nr:hypothetical protein [Herbaspirillum sp. SJZ107]TQK08245.1 hypothetical protein FBX97_3558 [Herbaspirillum sp. SJZ107]